MDDIAVHHDTIDVDDIYNVFPFCVIVIGLTKKCKCESQDGVDAIFNFKIYLVIKSC